MATAVALATQVLLILAENKNSFEKHQRNMYFVQILEFIFSVAFLRSAKFTFSCILIYFAKGDLHSGDSRQHCVNHKRRIQRNKSSRYSEKSSSLDFSCSSWSGALQISVAFLSSSLFSSSIFCRLEISSSPEVSLSRLLLRFFVFSFLFFVVVFDTSFLLWW